MNKLWKKIGAVLLCACMLMPMVPEAAMAETTEMNKVSEVYVNIKLPKVGNGEQAVECLVPENAVGYTVSCTTEDGKWLDGGGSVATEIVWVNETIYQAVFRVALEPNFEFASSGVKVYVNDEETGVTLLTDPFEDPQNPSPVLDFEFETMAEKPTLISEIELTNLPTSAIRDAALGYSHVTSEYKADGVWEKYDYTQGKYIPMDSTEQFAQENVYRLAVHTVANTGYQFGSDVAINGEILEQEPESSTSEIFYYKYVNYAKEIDAIEISSANLPKAEIGKTFSDTAIDVPVAEGSPYTVSGKWYYMDEFGNVYYEGTFEKGKEYYIEFSAVPLTGYSFTDNTSLFLDGEEVWSRQKAYTVLYHSERVSLKTIIDQVTLLNLPTATVGDNVTTGVFPVEVPEGAPYTATAEWYKASGNGSWEPVTSSIFEDKNRYKIEVAIEPKAEYELAEEVVVNAYGVEHMVGDDFSITWYEREFSFLTDISSIEITGYVEPKVGDDAVTNAATLQVPADANYEIVKAEWWEYISEGAEQVTTFEKGKDYTLYIFVSPKAGYEFTRNTTVTVNGNDVIIDLGDTELCAREYVSFKEVIPEVQVSNVPTVEIGKAAATDIKVPDGAKYNATVMWRVWDDAKREYAAFEGVFETGKVYELGVIVFPKDGYRFSEEDTVLKIDGITVEASKISSDRLIYDKGYQTEHKVIDRIELKIEEPVTGNHSSIAPVITVIGDANFTVIDDEDEIEWLIGTADKFALADREYFVADKTYGVYFLIQANEGYVFSDDLVIVINGKVIPKDAYTNALKLADVNYFFGMGTEEIVDDGTGDGTGEGITSPKTGDDSNISMYVSVFLVGMLVVSGALASRRRSMK